MTAAEGTGEPEQDCADVLEALYLFIDGELDDANAGLIQAHLHQCGPCLERHDLDRVVKTLVSRSCSEQAPAPLRERVLMSLLEVQVSQSTHGGTTRTTATHVEVVEQRSPKQS